MKLTALFAALFVTGYSSVSLAQEKPDFTSLEPKNFDTEKKDGFLSANEQKAWLKAIDEFEGPRALQAARFYTESLSREAAKGMPIAVSKLGAFSPVICDVVGKPILRESVSGANVLSCKGIASDEDGATISITDNRVSDAVSTTFKFGLAVPLARPKTFVPKQPTTLSLTERVFAFYLEGDGTTTSGDADQGTLEAGLLAGWRFERVQGGKFASQALLNTNIFYRTDTEFDANIFGFRTTYTPISLGSRLGGQIVDDEHVSPKNALFWTFQGEAEGLWVEDAGSTDLTTGDNSLWLGGALGVVYTTTDIGAHGVKAELTGEYRMDVLNGEDAALGTASLDYFLDKDQKTSLQLSYTEGTMYRDLSEVDQLRLNFSAKF